jgi:purine-binding chemotaxis protein CheW
MTSESFGRFSTHGSKADTASRTGDTRKGAPRGAKSSICAFWIGEQCFGLDTELVGEVVSIEDRVPIPLAPAAIHGIFNLRGEPLPLVSLADILGIVQNPNRPKVLTAMVLRTSELAAGLAIDRVQAILSVDRGTLTPPTNAAEDVLVLGFLEVKTETMTTVVSVLDPSTLLAKLMQLRFVQDQTA